MSKQAVILGIVGWRYFKDYQLFSNEVNIWIEENTIPDKIISGGCIGADKMAERFASENQIEMIVLRPEFKRYPGNMAYAMRDKEIAKGCTHLLAFPNIKKGKETQLTIQ